MNIETKPMATTPCGKALELMSIALRQIEASLMDDSQCH